MKVSSLRMFRGSLISAALVCLLITTAVCANTSSSWLQAVSFGGTSDDVGLALKVGSDGSQYFAGYFSSSVQFGNTLLTSYGGQDVFLAKRDSSGTVLWAIQAGGSSDDYATELALDGNDNIYLTGVFYDSATFGSTDGNNLPVTGSGETIFLAKYSPSGVLAWVQTGTIVSGDDHMSRGFGVVVQPTTGTVYLAGFGQEDILFSSANGNNYKVPGVGSWHMVLVQYDTDGNFYWGETNAASPNSMGISVAVDAQDNAYVVGWFENETTFYSQDGHNIKVKGFSPGQSDSNYPSDGFMAKYDSQGNAKWVNHFGGYKANPYAVAVAPAGDVTLVGFVGNINYGSKREMTTTITSMAPGKYRNLGGGHYTNPYNRDIIIATWDSAGVLRRPLRLGGKENEAASGIAYDASGRLWVNGMFEGTLTVGHRHLRGNKQQNLFVLQYENNKLRRAATALNATRWDLAGWGGPKIALDAAGNAFSVGAFQGAAYFGNIKLQSNGGFDIFLAELGLK
jgi:hypothetical protein